MINRNNPMYYFHMFMCFIFFIGVIHPLGTTRALADDTNKSVLDGYRSNDDVDMTDVDNSGLNDLLVPGNISEPNELLQEQSLFGMFFQLFIALVVIILMIYALIRFIGKRSQSYQTHRTLQNIGGVHVGSNRSIQLVRVGERVLVVGVGETIQLLKEIDEQSEVKKILEDYEIQEAQQQITSLVTWVQQKMNTQEGKSNSKIHFKGLLERQLTDVKNSQKKAHAVIKEREQ
ncbi:flagellar biosynthetic protein FliO [Anaerobacillus alkaliphilus]|nr:flagellar biosynthetic protein FliO [Anaerobacillus alkaliphilus]